MTYIFSKPRNVLIFVGILVSLLLNACGGGSSGSTGSSNGERTAYQQALAEYNNNNYNAAFTLFNTQLDSYPTGKYADNAHYYEGRILYSNRDYVAAQAQFDTVLTQFTNSNYFDSAQYWLAKTWHARGQFDTAIIEYNKVNMAGKWGDNVAYQLGKIDYDRAVLATTKVQAYKNYNDGIVKLRAMVDNPAYATSTSLDNAGYYLGRCYQEVGNLLLRDTSLSTTTPQKTAQDQFALAQMAFNKIANTSVYFDDANYQLIRISFEKGKTQIDPKLSYVLFETAINDFTAFLNNANFTTGNRIDDVDYYLGRSFQEQGYLLLKDATLLQQATLTPAVCLDANDCFTQARTNYASIPAGSIYSDDAMYYGARSYHESGNYLEARNQYQLLIDAATSSWADDAQYQKGKTYYDNGKTSTDPASALLLFNQAITELQLLPKKFASSNRLDSSIYFTGRSLQRQALLSQADNNLLNTSPPLTPDVLLKMVKDLFDNARSTYQKLINDDPSSKWSDNAMNRQAESHYEEAIFAIAIGDLAHDIIAQNSLSQAITIWNALLIDPLYKISNSADNAQYSLGRSYQLAIKIPLVNRQAITGGVDFTTPTVNSRAIIEFNKLVNTPFYQDMKSRWLDHAYYNLGLIYHQDALDAIANVDKQTAFDMALSNFDTVVTKYSTLNLLDNAANSIALVYHDTGVGYCSEEINWFTYVQSISVDPALKSGAVQHLAELQAIPAINHDCVTVVPVLSISKITAPLLK